MDGTGPGVTNRVRIMKGCSGSAERTATPSVVLDQAGFAMVPPTNEELPGIVHMSCPSELESDGIAR